MPELAIDLRTVGGLFGVDESARRLIHYKFAENVCMTTASGWASSIAADQGEVRARPALLRGLDPLVLARPAAAGAARDRADGPRRAADAPLVEQGRAAERGVPEVRRDDAAAGRPAAAARRAVPRAQDAPRASTTATTCWSPTRSATRRRCASSNTSCWRRSGTCSGARRSTKSWPTRRRSDARRSSGRWSLRTC